MLPLLKPNKVLKQNVSITNDLSENEKKIKFDTLNNLNNQNQNDIFNDSRTPDQIPDPDQTPESALLPNCFGNASTSAFVNTNLEIYERIKLTTQPNDFQNEIINSNNRNELHSISNSSSFSFRFGEKLTAVAEKISSKFTKSSFPTNFTSQKHNSEQNSEKVLLVPIFIDDKTINDSICQNSSVNVKFIDNNFTENPVNDRQCRICLMQSNGDEKGYWKKKKLIAPCKCSGTVQYVHLACLTHWIEVSSRKMYYLPKCELCGYKFRRKPFIDLTQIHFPYVDWCDRILNCLFLFLLAIMVLCAWVAIYYLQMSERKPLIKSNQNTVTKRFLTDNDVTVIIASILFFAAFFIALFTQYRAKVTIFQIISRMWATNRNWRIRNYVSSFDGDESKIKLNDNSKSANNNPEVSRTQLHVIDIMNRSYSPIICASNRSSLPEVDV